ncbi:TPA: hypothetical protein ACF3I9_000859 [Klebsiella aerogenes]
MTKVYITKYALTEGPFTTDGEIIESMVVWVRSGYRQYAHGKEWWLTEEEALADCERRRLAKIKSIDKQRKKVEEMKFTIDEQKAN